MTRGLTIFTLAAALPGMALAATPAAAPRPPVATPAKPAAPLPLTPGTRRVTLSPEGNAVAQKIMGSPDPRIAQIQAEMNAIQEEQKKVVAGPNVDVDKLEPLIRRKEALQAQLRSITNDKMIALLRALNDQDRFALLQSMVNPPQPQNSKPAAPAGH